MFRIFPKQWKPFYNSNDFVSNWPHRKKLGWFCLKLFICLYWQPWNPNYLRAERPRNNVVKWICCTGETTKVEVMVWLDGEGTVTNPVQDNFIVGTLNSSPHLNLAGVLTSVLHVPPKVSKIPVDLIRPESSYAVQTYLWSRVEILPY